MATPKQGKEVKSADDILLRAMITAEVQQVLQDEIPKLADRMSKRLYEKIRKRVTMNISRKHSTPEEDPTIKKGKIYHLTEPKENNLETEETT